MSALKRLLLLTTILTALPLSVRAQESLPDDPHERIVEGRPALYSVKRALHPITWVEAGMKPAFSLAESPWLKRLLANKSDDEKVAGVKFGAAGVGIGSGFGPVVTFFHKDLLGRGIEVEVPLLYTYGRYELYQFKAGVPIVRESFLDRLSFDIAGEYRSRVRDNLFAIGNDSAQGPLDEEATFRTVSREVSAGITAKFNESWKSGAYAGYRNVGVSAPISGRSAQHVFAGGGIPALASGAALRFVRFSIVHDTESKADFAFKGGRDEFGISVNEGAGKGPYSYQRYFVKSEHFIALTADGRKVIALRGLAESNQPNAGKIVPFFDMPALGSGDELRGYENFRFRDKSALAATIEYRYRIWPRLDWGLFLDGGQVASTPRDFAFNRFHAGYGVRLFGWLKPDLPISLDFGRSRETWRMYIGINTNF